jgi:L-serine dehydratase
VSISVFELFKIGVGPSSSHTVGPMLAASRFVRGLNETNRLTDVASVKVELFGSLGATGHGHGSVPAVALGLMGRLPNSVDPKQTPGVLEEIRQTRSICLDDVHSIPFSLDDDIVLHRRKRLEYHSNAMTFVVSDDRDVEIERRTYYSVGGGFIVDQEQADAKGELVLVPDDTPVAHPFKSGDELLAITMATGKRISDIVLDNEKSRRSEEEIRARLLEIWDAMRECVRNGTEATGTLPGGLRVRRRARALHDRLLGTDRAAEAEAHAAGSVDGGNDAVVKAADPLDLIDWVTLFALAVNEENAAGGRVVTAPTNGAAGIIPAVLHYYWNFVPGSSEDGVVRFLLVAGGIGSLFKENASISGAEVGCQGEVGSACSMAAAGLAEVLGGTPEQVENAAEIGIEHNLGLTCDPVGGLVQIPCIERNAVASIKAITAARMAIRGDGAHHVSLDKAIKTMRETGADMKDKYKETARGGLALNVVEC